MTDLKICVDLYSLRSMAVLSGALLSGEAAKTIRDFSAMLRRLGFVTGRPTQSVCVADCYFTGGPDVVCVTE